MSAKAKYYVDTAFNGHLMPDVCCDTLEQALDWCKGAFVRARIRYRGKIIARFEGGKRVPAVQRQGRNR